MLAALPGPLNIGDKLGPGGEKKCTDTNSWFRYKMSGPGPTSRQKAGIRTDRTQKFVKKKKKIYTSVEAKKQVLRDVYRL